MRDLSKCGLPPVPHGNKRLLFNFICSPSIHLADAFGEREREIDRERERISEEQGPDK